MLTKKDSPAQLSASDNMVLIDSSAGRVIVQLPPAAAMRGGQVIIKHAYDLDDVAARVGQARPDPRCEPRPEGRHAAV